MNSEQRHPGLNSAMRWVAISAGACLIAAIIWGGTIWKQNEPSLTGSALLERAEGQATQESGEHNRLVDAPARRTIPESWDALPILIQIDASPAKTTELGGFVYFRRHNAVDGSESFRLPVKQGRIDLEASTFEAADAVAAWLGGSPYIPPAQVDGGEPVKWKLIFEPFAGRLLEVLGPDGEAAEEVDFFLDDSGSPALHPLVPDPRSAIDATKRSGYPLLFQASRDQASTLIFIRTHASAWMQPSVDQESEDPPALALEPGGALEVAIDGGALMRRLVVHLQSEEWSGRPIPSVTWRSMKSPICAFSGLPIGTYTIRLGSPTGSHEDCMAIQRVEIRAQETAVVDLRVPGITDLPCGALEGVLVCESGAKPSNEAAFDGQVLLVHEEAHFAARRAFRLGTVGTLYSAAFQKIAARDHAWSWSARDLPAGRYRILYKPYGAQQEAWVEPGGIMVLPELLLRPTTVALRFLDEDLQQNVSPKRVRAERNPPDGNATRTTSLECLRSREDSTTYHLRALPGEFQIMVSDPIYGTFWTKHILVEGQDIEIQLRAVRWVTLRTRSGPIDRPQGESWWNELQVERANGSPADVLSRSQVRSSAGSSTALSPAGAAIRLCIRGREALRIRPANLASGMAMEPVLLHEHLDRDGGIWSPLKQEVVLELPQEGARLTEGR